MTLDQSVPDLLDRLSGGARGALLDRLAEHGEDFNVFACSSAQRRLWLLDQLRPGNPVYNVPYAFRLTGPVDVAALDRALRDLGERHESLRTVFVSVRGEPRQAVLDGPTYRLRVEDRPTPAGDRDAYATAEASREAALPFRLDTGPLLRARLVWLEPGADALFLLTLHHIVCDGWSVGILLQELAALYRAHRDGDDAGLPPVALQYVDFVRWQEKRQQSGSVQHWIDHLTGVPHALELPTDRARPAELALDGAIEEFTWPAETARALTAFCAEHRATPFTVLLAAYAAVLARHTGQDDLVVGTGVANRSRAESEGTVGFFANTLAIRVRPAADLPFRALLDRVREDVLAAQSHQDAPFEAVVDAVVRDRSPAWHPLVQTVLVMQDGDPQSPGLDGVDGRRVAGHSGTAKFDLMVGVTGLDDDGLRGWIEYDTALFDRERVLRLAGHLRELLAGALAAPDTPVGDLPLLTAAELAALRGPWAAGPGPDHGAATDPTLVHQLVEARADATPDAVAVVAPDGELTYGELEERANRLANHLRSAGAVPESLIGICLDRSLDLVVAMLAVLKSGAAYLPLDPQYPTARIAFMIADAGATTVLTVAALEDRLPADVDKVRLDVPVEGNADRPAPVNTPDQLAYVIYTSGSTGRPKGAMIPHRGVVNLAREQVRAFGTGPDDRVLQFASFSFDASVLEIMLALHAGARLVVAHRHELQPGPDLTATMRRHGVTITFLPPTVLRLMDPADLPGLRTLVVGGEPCPDEFAKAWAPGRNLVNIYGPTESTIWVTWSDFDGTLPMPIGRTIGDVRAYVLDERLQPVPVGVPGELCLGGVGVARGYLGRPALTADRFVPDGFGGAPGARLYRSGDIVRWAPDGNLEYLRRVDGQVKLRGFRIELSEVQSVLSEAAGVRAAVATIREDVPGEPHLIGYVVPEAGAPVDAAALRAHLRRTLPEHMVPAAFVELSSIPHTTNGKLDTRALPAPRHLEKADADEPAALPEAGLRRVVATVWATVLNHPAVGVDDNFFDLGGNSLLLVRVRTALEERLGREVPTLALFRYPTVRSLADHLEGVAAPAPASAPVADSRRTLLARAARRTEGAR